MSLGENSPTTIWNYIIDANLEYKFFFLHEIIKFCVKISFKGT